MKYPIQTWTDPKILAGLHRYLVSRQVIPRSRSNLVASALGVLHDALAGKGAIERIEDDAEAMEYLASYGLAKQTRGQNEDRG